MCSAVSGLVWLGLAAWSLSGAPPRRGSWWQTLKCCFPPEPSWLLNGHGACVLFAKMPSVLLGGLIACEVPRPGSQEWPRKVPGLVALSWGCPKALQLLSRNPPKGSLVGLHWCGLGFKPLAPCTITSSQSLEGNQILSMVSHLARSAASSPGLVLCIRASHFNKFNSPSLGSWSKSEDASGTEAAKAPWKQTLATNAAQ